MSVDRAAVITGSASGIGLALTRHLLDAGWRVHGIDRQPWPAGAHAGYTHHLRDLTDIPGISGLADALPARLRAFVHCAGVMRSGGVGDSRAEDTELLWRLHGAAPLALVGLLGPRLTPALGRIVLLSSRAVLGRAQRAAYAATKAAQIGMARSLAAELIGRGITVNVVAPGAVDTPMLNDPRRGAPPKVDLPLGRLIRPDEVVAAIDFFLAPQAGAVTGQTLYVCGGASLGAMAV
ncbi:SDR family NAD(P)-dependent oxidoreductase [Bordetella pseudohinzii]|uniref:3-oxoacyl-[acyl-carrier-protein] reductase FabG n=1 Tax=Bordetella pseudohinzii TaxID=1331258 RepID=A0A0J6C4C2_9BORD|nr:SDR family oxidoreductase [Bordetella pseudohinzii]ANY17394.1 short-chain dehydrogenase [Bordetella pseudohinzii]KMM25611.1 short-chain dehydrogenase [Bordetella pseudohinzii]KXA81610.1 short-chain dehydrogenase [Bordetella pseudohinzii]KXA83149.1 short-chain dehydrogenase [Bordetella pseudohinzii]CUI70296.1 3-oxoacyl-[acyl-carrier-protein] reductase FabG [Bordetella pseudohinzii]